MRLFIAIELPTDVRDHLLTVRGALQPLLGKASLTHDEKLHITLKFLGEVDQRKQSELTESLSRIRAGGSIELRAESIQCFPPRGPVRIVAAGFGGDGIGGVRAIHQAIEQRCQFLGFDRETRDYRPHVTLARARPTLPAAIRDQATAAAAPFLPGPSFPVLNFVLMQSHLLPEGARYEVIHRVGLAPD